MEIEEQLRSLLRGEGLVLRTIECISLNSHGSILRNTTREALRSAVGSCIRDELHLLATSPYVPALLLRHDVPIAAFGPSFTFQQCGGCARTLGVAFGFVLAAPPREARGPAFANDAWCRSPGQLARRHACTGRQNVSEYVQRRKAFTRQRCNNESNFQRQRRAVVAGMFARDSRFTCWDDWDVALEKQAAFWAAPGPWNKGCPWLGQ